MSSNLLGGRNRGVVVRHRCARGNARDNQGVIRGLRVEIASSTMELLPCVSRLKFTRLSQVNV